MAHTKEVKEFMRELFNWEARTFDNMPWHGIHSVQEKQAWMDILTKALNGAGRLKVLDVGTGTGVMALLLAEMGHIVTGIDISPMMLEMAQEKARKCNLRVELRLGDAEDLPFEDESFDVVVARHLLRILPNPQKALAEWKRVLIPRGKLIIIDAVLVYNKHKTLLKEIWCYLAKLLILLSEWRDPLKRRYKQIEKYLPMSQQKRPEADVKLLEGLGFEVDVSEVKIPKNYTFFNYLKYGYTRNYYKRFVVKGVKK